MYSVTDDNVTLKIERYRGTKEFEPLKIWYSGTTKNMPLKVCATKCKFICSEDEIKNSFYCGKTCPYNAIQMTTMLFEFLSNLFYL